MLLTPPLAGVCSTDASLCRVDVDLQRVVAAELQVRPIRREVRRRFQIFKLKCDV